MKQFSLFVLFIISFSFVSFTQSVLLYEENPQKAARFRANIPEDKVLIVIESELNLSFDSTMEFLEEPQREGDLYMIYVSKRIFVLQIEQKETGVKLDIPFGQQRERTYPALQLGEVKFYTVIGEWKLTVVGQEGEGDNQMRYQREAILLFTVDPPDMELEFSSTIPITEVDKDRGRYRLYVQPNDQTININHIESGAYFQLQINDLEVKDVRYFFVSLPHSLRQIEVQSLDQSIATGSYRVESKPPGALIQLAGSSAFNRERNRTPHTISGERAGTNIITLTLDDYETVIDTIQIGSDRVNFSSYELKPTFALLNFSINPSPPFSEVYVDGNILDGVQNNKKVKVGLGDRRIRIGAEHFYEENFIISTAAGREIPINVNLKPKMGKVTFEVDTKSSGAEVYIQNNEFLVEKTKLGKILQRTSFELQEGQYRVTLTKDGFGDQYYDLSILHHETSIIKATMREGRSFTFQSEPLGAELYINNKWVGYTPYTSSLAFDNYSIKLVNNTRTKETNINLTSQSSNIQSFEVHEHFGTFIDERDGKEYKWVKIGEQIWMAENLAFQPQSSRRSRRLSFSGSGNMEYFSPNGSERNIEKYGYLYDYNTAKSVCPTGWKLPNLVQWKALTSFLSGLDITENWQIQRGVPDHDLNFQVSAGWRTQLGAHKERYDFLDRNSFFWIENREKGSWVSFRFTNDRHRKLNYVNYSHRYDGDLSISIRCVKE